MVSRHWMVGLLSLGLTTSCVLRDDPDPLPEDPEVTWPTLKCDSLVEDLCAFPFPNNVFTVRDESTMTGRRVSFSHDMMPVNYYEQGTAPDPWNTLDGFSTGSYMLAYFPGVTQESLDGLPTSVTIERSLEDDCPTIVLDVETGLRVPHWIDLDATTEEDDKRAFMVRPAQRLRDGHRYIVAIGQLDDGDGNPVPPSPAFEALRDAIPSDDASVRSRRGLYEDIFAQLQKAGMERDDLLLAWDFTTASKQSTTERLVHMRDEALAMAGPDGPPFEIVDVDTEFDPEFIQAKLIIMMDAPLYLDKPGPGANLIYGADGLPEPNPQQPTARYAIEVLIPNSASPENPASIMQYGHGLLGEKEQIRSGHFREFMNTYNYAIFGVDFVGMADEDEIHVGAFIASGRFDLFDTFVDRQHQGMLNSLLAMRLMKTGFIKDPDYGPLLDPQRAYYHGISQGGIFGGTYMALTTDVHRGALGVMGMPYNILLTRSVDFDLFFDIVRSSYPDARLHHLLLDMGQMLWDRTEPNGYAAYIVDDTLPNTPSHQVFMRAALGDHQVTTLGADYMARAIGAVNVESGQGDIFGIDTVQPPFQGSGMVLYDLGLPADPVQNVPQRECEDPHGKIRKFDEARQQLDLFLQSGVIDVFCEGGVCDFHAESGCDAGGE